MGLGAEVIVEKSSFPIITDLPGKAEMHYVLMITTRGPRLTLLSELQQILPAASPLTGLFPVSLLKR